MRPLVCKNLAGDVATVERPAYRLEPGPTVTASRALLVTQELEDPAEVRLHQSITGFGNLTARHPDGDVVRPVTHVVAVLAQVVEHDGMAGEAPGCVLHGAPSYIPERHGSPPFQRLEAGIGRGRHDSAPHTERNVAPVPRDERVGVERARPAADSCDRDHLAGFG